MEVTGQLRALVALPTRKESPCIPWMGGWVGPRTGLGRGAEEENPIITPEGNRTPVLQPVA